MSRPAPIEDLLRAEAYPHPCATIELVETHISWVLLTGSVAYKIRKPVDFGFVDFSTLEHRRRDCEEELRCNRPFAPELYLEVVPIYRDGRGAHTLIGDGDPVEHAVKMVQFDREQQLDRLLERDALEPAELAAFGRTLAGIQRDLPPVTPRPVWPPVQECLEVLGGRVSPQVREALLARHDALAEDFARRAAGDRFRECHGDLHLSNLLRTERGVRAFDCLEFNPDLRAIDVISDVAFLWMDCSVRERDDLAYAFVDGWLEATGDLDALALLGFYGNYRSLVRAKVAALRGGADPVLRRHVDWTERRLRRPRGRLVLMCGLSGSGKSWVAERLVPRLGALRLRSDALRLRPDYSEDGRAATYRRLERSARRLLAEGESVIVDATFLDCAQRDRFAALGPARIVYCTAPTATLERRLRRRDPDDPSDATVAVLHEQLARFEPPAADEPVSTIDSELPDWDALVKDVTLVT